MRGSWGSWGSQVLALGVMAAGAYGCQDTDGTGTATGPEAAALAKAYCLEIDDVAIDRIAACVGIAREVEEALVQSAYACDLVDKGVTAGRIGYDTDAAAMCLATWRAMTCDDLAHAWEHDPPAACRRALVGQVGEGGACYSGDDCSDEAFCDGWCPETTCRLLKKVGETCAAGLDRCELGASCSADGHCVAFALPGQPCRGPSGGVCAGPTFCSGDDTTPGTCLPRKTDGPCADERECAWTYECKGLVTMPTLQPGVCTPKRAIGDACEPGQGDCHADVGFCDAAGKTCQPHSKQGGLCGEVMGETVRCFESWCDAAAGAAGTCQAFRKPGQSCATGASQCVFASACDGSTCLAPCDVP